MDEKSLTNETSDKKLKNDLKPTYLILPHWGLLFLIIGGVVLLIVHLLIALPLGFSSASDSVFAVEALFSCIITDIIFRKKMNRKLVVGPKLTIPVYPCYTLVCLYIFIFQPF